MNISPETPTGVRTVAGIAIKMPEPYATGHVCTEGEASQLNQVFAENVLNNLRKQITAGVVDEAGNTTREFTEAEAQDILDKYLVSYEMGVRQRGEAKPTMDPVEREARKLAKESATAYIKGEGGKPKDYDMDAIADAFFQSNPDVYLAEAKKLLKARENAKDKATTGIDVSSFLKPASTEEAAAE